MSSTTSIIHVYIPSMASSSRIRAEPSIDLPGFAAGFVVLHHVMLLRDEAHLFLSLVSSVAFPTAIVAIKGRLVFQMALRR